MIFEVALDTFGAMPFTLLPKQVAGFSRTWSVQAAPFRVLDPCIDDPAADCGSTHGCYDDGPTCIGRSSCLQWNIVALTSVLYDPATGRILEADMEVNGWDGLGVGGALSPPRHGWYFTCGAPSFANVSCTVGNGCCTAYGQGSCSYVDLQNTVTHEAGHFIGLRHPCTTDTGAESDLPSCALPVPAGQVPYGQRTMAPTTAPLEITKRDLSADEATAVCDIYPASSGGCGCGAGSGGGLALLLAALALRPRRRCRSGRRPV
jgi:hypothetical protein